MTKYNWVHYRQLKRSSHKPCMDMTHARKIYTNIQCVFHMIIPILHAFTQSYIVHQPRDTNYYVIGHTI